MQRSFFWLSIILLVLTAAIGAGGYFIGNKSSFRNEVINPPLPAPEINMTDDNGNVFRLSETRGKVVLLYFGFVNCPLECPLTMAHVKQALEILGSTSRNVQMVMVSTDPVNDTPQSINNFLAKFDSSFLGIPGTGSELNRIWTSYGVTVLDGGETHSSYTYVIDQKGYQRLLFTPETSPEDIAADLNILLVEK